MFVRAIAVKALFTLALALTQLLASGASPLYLCQCANGSTCIDFGPATCGCCQHDDEHADVCCAEHDSCRDHQQSARATAPIDDPCDCRHVRICEPQTVTRSMEVDAPRGDWQFLSLIATLCPATAGLDLTRAADCRELPRWLHAPPPTLALLASVVIRC